MTAPGQARGAGLTSRIMLAQVLVLLASILTAGLVALIVGPPLFHEHLLQAGHPANSPELTHIEEAYRTASAISLGVALIIALACAGAVTWYVTRRLRAPLDVLTHAAKEVARGHLEARVPAGGPGIEFDLLGHAFNLMASQLQQTEDTRRRLLSDLAHELRTPIATLKIYCEGLADGVIRWDEDTQQVLTEQTDRLARLTEDIDDVSRAEEGRITLDRDRVPVRELIRTAVASNREAFARAGVTLTAETVSDARLVVVVDTSRLAQVLRQAVWSRVRHASEALVVPRGSRRWRVDEYDAQEILDELTSRGVRYGAAREMLPRRLAHAVLVRMERAGDTPDDRVQDGVARSKPVKDYAKSLWPALDPAAVLFGLWSNAATLADASDGILSDAEQRTLLWDKVPRSRGAAQWTSADTVLLDEIADLLERTPSLGHIILDEAQDLSPMQLRAVGRRASTGSLTVLGDLAQGTTPWATASWAESLEHLGKRDAHVEELTRGFRVPASVLEYAARLLPQIAPGLALPESVRSHRGRLELVPAGGQLHAATSRAVAAALAGAPGTVGVIVADADLDALGQALTAAGPEDSRVQLIAATLAKGLEFDQVVLVEPAAIAAAEPDERTGLRRLYVVLTRAVSGLTIVHEKPLPAVLSGPLPHT